MPSIFSTQNLHTFLRRKYCFLPCRAPALSPPVARSPELRGPPPGPLLGLSSGLRSSVIFAPYVVVIPWRRVRQPQALEAGRARDQGPDRALASRPVARTEPQPTAAACGRRASRDPSSASPASLCPHRSARS